MLQFFVQQTQPTAISLTPDVALATGSVIAPSVTLGTLTLTASAALATGTVVAPTVTVGALSISPEVALATATVVDVTATLGAISLSPETASATASAVDPTLDVSGGGLEPQVALATATAIAPSVSVAAITITPEAAAAIATVVTPDIANVLSLTPEAALGNSTAIAPSVTVGAVSLTPETATATATVVTVTITGGDAGDFTLKAIEASVFNYIATNFSETENAVYDQEPFDPDGVDEWVEWRLEFFRMPTIRKVSEQFQRFRVVGHCWAKQTTNRYRGVELADAVAAVLDQVYIAVQDFDSSGSPTVGGITMREARVTNESRRLNDQLRTDWQHFVVDVEGVAQET